MSNDRKKRYFCQNNHLDPKLHRSKYFDTIKEAMAWIVEQGGGIIKKRDAKTIHASGYGLGRVEFDPPLRVWGEIYDSNKDPNFGQFYRRDYRKLLCGQKFLI